MDTSDNVAERGVRLLQAEYERQKVLLAEHNDQYVRNLQEFAREHPEFAGTAQRLLSQHFGWV